MEKSKRNENFLVKKGQSIGQISFNSSESEYIQIKLLMDKSEHAKVTAFFDPKDGKVFALHSNDERLQIIDFNVSIGDNISKLPLENRLSEVELHNRLKLFKESYCYDGICFFVENNKIESIALFISESVRDL